MSNKHNIDRLFEDKLHGRSASGNPDSYWVGAEHLLDNHFRWLWIKKALFIVAPLVVLALASGFYFISDAESSASMDQPSISTASAALPTSEALPTQKDQRLKTNQASVALPAEDSTSEVIPLKAPKAELNASSVTEKNDVALKTTALSKQDRPSTLSNATINTEPAATKFASVSMNDVSSSKSNSSLLTTPSKTADLLDEMPAFSIRTLGLRNTADITDRDQLSGEALMNELRKFEVSAHLGGVLANGLTNIQPEKDPLGYGVYTGVTLEYYFNNRIYGKTGAILNTRNSIASDILIDHSGSYAYANQLVYLDIPIQVGYRFGARHAINFGMAFSPLVDVLEQSTTDQPYEYNPDGGLDLTAPRETRADARPGFANFDVAGLIGYEMQLSTRVNLQVQFRYGLFDVTDNQFWNVAVVDDRNHQFRLGLSYRLLNR